MARALLVSYCGAFLVSAALMFTAQPMIAKMVLPAFGGSSSVWTTCMLFFQTTLLGGYLYAFAMTRWVPLRVQFIVHLVLMAAAMFTLPFVVRDDWVTSSDVDPAWMLSGLLIVMSAAPMFVISTTAPLLQRWFAETNHSSADDPYFLYAVSNFGSMIALLVYPFLIEPNYGLANQAAYWRVGFVLLIVLVFVSVLFTLKLPRKCRGKEATSQDSSTKTLTSLDRFWWVALALIPSSWMLSVTTRLTTDIAPMPLLWIVPLALYLLTFILVFARKEILPHRLMTTALPLAVMLLFASQICAVRTFQLTLNLTALFVGAMYCHGELVRRRPDVEMLPQFYVWMSVGGALGGLLNAIVAPQIFPALMEYPLAIAFACTLHPGRSLESDKRRGLIVIAITAAGLVVLIQNINATLNATVVLMVIAVSPILLILYYARLQKVFALVLTVAMVWSEMHASSGGQLIHTQRSFYGIHRVVEDNKNAPTQYRYLLHGTTQHGFQRIEGAERSGTPLGYYHRSGPLGDVMSSFETSDQQHIAVIGLGVGATACYAAPNRSFTFYEVDPVVKRIAETPEYFSYLSGSGAKYEIIVGDGRTKIASASDGKFQIIMLDAFSSDSIPTHLLTRQALTIYESKLANDGVLVFHISNKYLDLKNVLGDLALDADLFAIVREDPYAIIETGKSPSTYVVMARDSRDLSPLLSRPGWQLLDGDPDGSPWTDDYSNLFEVLK